MNPGQGKVGSCFRKLLSAFPKETVDIHRPARLKCIVGWLLFVFFIIGIAQPALAVPPQIDAGVEHTVALKADGTVWAWGANYSGQLGDGTSVNSPTPVQVAGLTGVLTVSAGYQHTVALKEDGSVWAWGNNTWGQLGDGTTMSALTPVQVSGLTGISSISAGSGHTVALKSDGTVWVWGHNSYGQLGDGTTSWEGVPIPVLVSGLSSASP